MVSSDSTYNDGFTDRAVAPPQPIIDRSEVSRMSSPLLSGSAQSSQENHAPMDFSSGGARSGDSRTALLPVLGCSPCLATTSALKTETENSASNDISDNAELFVTRHVTDPEQKVPLGPTTNSSSPDASVPPPDDTDTQSNTREVFPCDYTQSLICDLKTPGPTLGQTPAAPLTPGCAVDTLARDSSLSPIVGTSGIFMHLTPPLSSPLTGCNVSTVEVDCSSNRAEIDDYPAITMSSPTFGLHEDEPPSSPSPPHRTTSTKRAQRDESDEVRR